jgi:hypothetical protein
VKNRNRLSLDCNGLAAKVSKSCSAGDWGIDKPYGPVNNPRPAGRMADRAGRRAKCRRGNASEIVEHFFVVRCCR